ncbi:recombination regulator RecX [Corynebacterium lubricantis]|uniref:recombination regulator RecX n=1 Tax=Corynebacterium lubricantis TaxID=541095 RepID=UPI00037D3720|nr:recombination regulator RecX [Corynebacterium lubricantis]
MQPDPEKLAKLQAALEAYEAGESPALFDRAAEEARAPIRKRALGLLDQRARSRSELRTRLIDAEFEAELVDDVLDGLEEAGLIDDRAFATEWVRQRSARRGKSSRALDLELRDKGVAAEVRADALEQISEDTEETIARGVAEKKARAIKAVPQDRTEYDKYLRRIVGVLARRGFSSGMSLSLAKNALDTRIEELD